MRLAHAIMNILTAVAEIVATGQGLPFIQGNKPAVAAVAEGALPEANVYFKVESIPMSNVLYALNFPLPAYAMPTTAVVNAVERDQSTTTAYTKSTLTTTGGK